MPIPALAAVAIKYIGKKAIEKVGEKIIDDVKSNIIDKGVQKFSSLDIKGKDKVMEFIGDLSGKNDKPSNFKEGFNNLSDKDKDKAMDFMKDTAKSVLKFN